MTRLPIQKGMLDVIIRHIRNHFLTHPYLEKLFNAIFASAYYGLLRIGEVTTSEHVILADNVHIAENKQKILFVLRSSKTHWADSKPQMVKVTAEDELSYSSHYPQDTCPFKILREYLHLRPIACNKQEQFFVYADNSPVKPANVRKILKIMLNDMGLDHSLYGMHSFRIGRASDLLNKLKYTVESIKKIGRWGSNAIYTYLRG